MLKDSKKCKLISSTTAKKLQWLKKEVNGEATQKETCQSLATYEPYLDSYLNKQALKKCKTIIKM